ncbi:hypothetical protein [Bradyrhizobium canariense]|uniref:hypothetical protein n=1 Tax=Bradyrhizobium canariense TaxID=255045 RepID=UPI001178B7A4|nr:hypothetical protein [Bradyrhizobium canariense]
MAEQNGDPRVRLSRGLGSRTDEFDETYRQLRTAIKPRDRIEEMYAEDLAHSGLQTATVHRAASQFVAMRWLEALHAHLVRHRPVMSDADRVALIERWSGGNPDARAEVAALLEEAGLTELNIEAEAMIASLPTLIALEQLQSSKGARRDKALAGLAFYRRMQAQEQLLARECRKNLAPEALSLRKPPTDEQ